MSPATKPRDPYGRLRRICSAFPEVVERQSHGEAAWFVGGKRQFVTTSDHHHDDRVAMWLAAPPGVQERLVAEAPGRYFRPPYVGHRGWVGAYLDVPVDWAEIEDLVEDAYRLVAPARLVAQLGSGG
ncbi:MAG TPA: MmcQ/YjbR family DNA-binding protein [Actinomycetota bacterium]|nr:MmcQ/YjbR family DNA-binding protein [Actinomycetota bacterium]